MKKRIFSITLMVFCFIATHALTVSNLRVQGMINPIGIDSDSPTFSWVIESNQRNVTQKSYSLKVATDAALGNVVWESGAIESDKSVDVGASGLNLSPRTRYYWQVTVTDNKGNTALSSEKAYFETGLMTTDGWGATKWIKATTSAVGTGDVTAINDYEFSVKFNIQNLAAGLIFAAKDHNNYYMWQINTATGSPRFRPHRWSGGNPALITEKAITNVSIKNNEEHTLKILVTGATTANTYVDNVLVDTRTGDFSYGDFGFREDYDNGNVAENSLFDDFAVSSNGKTLLQDDFSTENIMFTKGTIENGKLHVVGPATYSWQKKVAPIVKYDVDVDMTLINDNASICFSATGPNTYMMWAVNTFNLATPVIRRHVYNNGALVYSDTPLTLTKADIINKSHHIKIECRTPYVYTYIDGVLADTYKDADGVLAVGDLGFRVSATGQEREKAYFDNLKLTLYDDSNNATVKTNETFEGTTSIFDNADVRDFAGSRQIYMEANVGGTKRLMQTEGSVLPGAPIMRKTFTVSAGVKKARLYASGLGIYNAYINGIRVGQIDDDGAFEQDELKPGSTDFKKTVFYTTHDVTSLLKEGDNAIGAEVTSGWWNGGIAHGEFGNKDCAFRGLLVITYENGTEQTIPTDLTWKSNNNGAVRKGDIYNGETYDARLESDWAKAGFDDSSWYATSVSNDFGGKIISFEGPAIKAVSRLARTPKQIFVYEGTVATGTTYGMLKEIASYSADQPITLKAGQTVIYDLGQNAAGWVNFTAKGDRGTRLRFRFSEMRNETGDTSRGDDGPGGSLYLINLRSAEASLYYTMKGGVEGETFHPTTTYYGFRFIEVTANADVTLEKVVGETVTSAMTEKSSLKTNIDVVNQLYSNIIWGQRSNFVSVPTDCPQRDERLGWTADTQVYSMAGLYNADTRSFYEKWMRDMRDSQNDNGAYPHVAPYSWGVGYGASAWADAGIILPWKVYLMTGDKKILKDNWASMEKYMNWLSTQIFDGYKYNGGTTTYGDWVSFVDTDKRYISVSYYAYDAQLMAKMAAALSESSTDLYALKVNTYTTLFNNIKAEWQLRYLNLNKIPRFSTQCAYLMALKYNLLPDEESKTRTIAALKRSINNNSDMLNTGFLGTAILNQTLTQYGLNDEAYTLLLQRECPSWLYSVDQGATTVWERWNSYTKATGFHKDISMNSFNHYAYGAVAEWMFRYMAGVSPDETTPGFKHFLLSPNPDNRATLKYGQERVTDVDANYWSEYGNVRGQWTSDGNGNITYNVTVPANTTATLYMPCPDGVEVMESGVNAEAAEGVVFVEKANGKAVYNLGSGVYSFTVAIPLAINDVADEVTNIDTYYNLQGMRLENSNDVNHAVYIRNGKKILK